MSGPDPKLLARVNETLRRRGGTSLLPHGELKVRCLEPDHDDRNPSAGWSTRKGCGGCRGCGASWSTRRAAELLGLDYPANSARASKGGKRSSSQGKPRANAKRPSKTWEIRNRVGQVVALHHRSDGPDGKRIWWSGPNGKKGLPCAASALPLYGAELLDTYDKGQPLYITEGEKAADGARALGLQAVGTVTGAASCPGAETLRDLDGFNVRLWPDHDRPGWRHAKLVWLALQGLGIEAQGVVDTGALWGCEPENGDGQDVADLEALPEAELPLLQNAAASHVPPRNDATAQYFPPPLAILPSILRRFAEAVRLRGVVGESATAQTLYLAFTSRLLDKPVSVAVKGHSASGKSNTVQKVREFLPDDAVVEFTAMSEKGLIYSDQEYKHRTIIMYEVVGLREGVEDDLTSYFVRSLLSEGRLDYEVTVKADGGFTTKRITKEGPTNIIFTTTKTRVHAENETRVLSLNTDDSPDQTRRVLLALADENQNEVDLDEWRRLQSWLETAEHRVTIPYGQRLAELMPAVAVRLRRDFGAVLALIRAHAILHQCTRGRDQDGRIVAAPADYEAVHDLIGGVVSEGVGATVSDVVQETVRTVGQLAAGDGVTVGKVAEHLRIDKSNASRRLRRASDGGYIRNMEDKRGKPARWVLGDPLPGEVAVLPQPATLLHPGSPASIGSCDVAPVPEGIEGEIP